MNQSKLILLFSIFCSLFLIACSEPNIQDDAKRAAKLSIASNEAAVDKKLDTAGDLYNEVQAIMDKYKQAGKFQEFYEIYTSCLQENAEVEYQKIETVPSPESKSTKDN